MGEEAQAPAPKKSYDPLTVSERVWAGNSSIKLRSGKPLPDRLEGARGVTLIVSSPMSLAEIAASLGAQTGVPVRVAADQMSVATAMGGVMPAGDTMSVAYEGPLSGLLELVAGRFGLNWAYDGSAINLSRYETRVFTIQAMPGELTIKDGLGEAEDNSSSSSSTSGAGASYSASSSSSLKQSSEMNVEMKVWDELAQTITALLGGVGSAVVSPSSGTVTVTTTPDVMHIVAKFISEENQRLAHQIAINVEIYSVSLEDGDEFNASFSTAFSKIGDFSINAVSATGAQTQEVLGSMGGLSMAILNPSDVQRVGSVFKALSSIGDTTRVAQFPMTTLNNRPVARRIGRDRTYVASITNDSSTTSSFASSTITPGTVREGFSLQLTPRLLDDGRIMLQYSFSLIDILNMNTFDTGNAGSVELPETSSRVFVQQSLLRSGSTLVIGGYDDERTEQSSQGVGNPYNYFLGGSSTNSKTRSMMFIAITPQVVDVMAPEQY
jgi:type IVB pilus formation R64 PilN family outer membrane protein